MAARRRLKRVKINASTPLADLRYELEQIQAAMWLIDQVDTGDLSFLTNAPRAFTCWNSFVTLSAEDLADRLRHMAHAAVVGALKDADAALRAAAAQPPRVEGLAGGRA